MPSCSSDCKREGNDESFYDESGTSEDHHIHAKMGNEGTENKCGTMDVPHLFLSPHPTAFTQTLLRKTYSQRRLLQKTCGGVDNSIYFSTWETEKDCLNNQYNIQQSFSKCKGRKRICCALSFHITDDKAQQGCF